MTAEELNQFNVVDGSYLNRLIMWQPLDDETLKRYQDTWHARNNELSSNPTNIKPLFRTIGIHMLVGLALTQFFSR